MALFSNARKKLAREAAQKLVSGHMTLVAFWALRHAGVLAAMDPARRLGEGELAGVDPGAFAEAAKLSGETLQALLTYVERQGLAAQVGGRYVLTATGQALLEYEDGLLEHLWAYQGVLQMLEHLLARLKTYGHGVNRKGDVLFAGQMARWRPEVFPAIVQAVEKSGVTHLLDLQCGTGELLVHIAEQCKKVVGVGVCADGALVRQANDLIAQRGLEKRLIAVPAGASEVCLDTRRTFERIGISPQLWEKFDGLLACNVFTEQLAQDREKATRALAALPAAFPGATLFLAEPCTGPRLEKNYYAAEMQLLSDLSHSEPLTEEAWREVLSGAGLPEAEETALQTDGLTLFACRLPERPKAETPPRPAATKR